MSSVNDARASEPSSGLLPSCALDVTGRLGFTDQTACSICLANGAVPASGLRRITVVWRANWSPPPIQKPASHEGQYTIFGGSTLKLVS